MVSIYLNGEDRTAQIIDWSIAWSDKYQNLQLRCHFRSTKTFTLPLSQCRIHPSRELTDTLLSKPDSAIVDRIDHATIYGDRFAVVLYPGSARPYVYKLANVGFVMPSAMKETPVFRYFAAVAAARVQQAAPDQKAIADNVVRQLQQLPARPDTALHAYCTGQNAGLAPGGGLIYPFGVNESQLAAVERAFSAQVSVIEGPPGTGKTQTILNILANIVVRGKTVAVLSNNNSAVTNVYEKLDKAGLGYLVAKLGSKENRDSFFAAMPSWPSTGAGSPLVMEDIQATLARLKQHLHDHNRAAQLQAEIDELHIERTYLRQWQEANGVQVSTDLDKYRLSPGKTADLMAYLAHLGQQRIGLKDRVELLFGFSILRVKPFAAEARASLFHALQMHYYDKALQEREAALDACRASLAAGRFKELLARLTAESMRYLKNHLDTHVPAVQAFDAASYKRNFDGFLRRFPILGSSSHSIVNSIAKGAVLDYVIIDEASQQDIVPGILALGCARNLIVVGDSRQLAHIPVALGMAAPADAYDCERHSLLDSCIGVFGSALPRTLLKEHYRCHPRIIGFCNQQFYDNALVPMAPVDGDMPLRLVLTAKGNHARRNSNQREIDSLLKVLDADSESAWLDGDGRGFIAPYRSQATLSGAHLPEDFVTDTVHKFQGRECEEIVFSTVLDKQPYNQQRLQFVDDARMVNVAVSRAKHRFTLVTGDDVFSANNGHIAALIRYVEYYAEPGQVLRAPVVSAFDLLYTQYDHSLERLQARLRPADSNYRSEQIVAQLLREALSDPSRRALTFHTQIALNQIASTGNPALTAREREFMAQRASCDFVLYFKVGKIPVGVIEVDGGSHVLAEQKARDALKDSILARSGLLVLRLRTVDSDIEDKIAEFLAPWCTVSAED